MKGEFWGWLIEYTKKVVTLIAILYLVCNVFTIFICYRSLGLSGDITILSTLISEINETFRVTIAGYLIKATFENLTKIKASKTSEANFMPDNYSGERETL